MPLSLDTRNVGDATIVRCGGRVVAGGETDSLRDHVAGVLQEHRDIVLHLGDVTFIDSSGLGTLVRLLSSTRRVHGDLKLCNVPANIREVLRMTNLSTLFAIHDSEEDAVLAFYQRSAARELPTAAGPTVLCVDQSADVLAYLRELLRSAGYNLLTSGNLRDALILLRATRPSLLILGPSMGASPGTEQAFRKACAHLPIVELGAEFSTSDAGQAASELLERIRVCLREQGSVSRV